MGSINLTGNSAAPGVTGAEMAKIALENVGQACGETDCARILWAETNLGGLPLFDLRDNTVGNDPGMPKDQLHVVPKSAHPDASGDGWKLVSQSTSASDMKATVLPGDAVRVYAPTTDGGVSDTKVHSFMIVSVDGDNVQVVDNFSESGTTIVEHPLNDIVNYFAPDGQFGAVTISRVDDVWVNSHVDQSNLQGNGFGDFTNVHADYWLV